MIFELKTFAIQLGILLILAPLVGFYMLKFVDLIQNAWKTNDRKKKWVVMSTIFAIVAGLAGWFH